MQLNIHFIANTGMKDRNSVKNLTFRLLKPIQGVSELYSPGHGAITNPGIEFSNVPIFYKRYRVIDSLPLPTCGYGDPGYGTRRKNNPYFQDTLGVVNIHNSNLKSQFIKKECLSGRGPSMGPKLERRLYG